MVKKVTAPKTYNPGKGRPREHLAYLNEREMAYLRSINGNNMERGPRGLPSFPPDDAIGSSSVASSGGGRTGNSTGPGGPSGPNSGPSQSTSGGSSASRGSGSREGGGPGGPSGPNSGPSRSSGSQSGSREGGGPGGPSGPNSGPSSSVRSSGPGGPSGPNSGPSSASGGRGAGSNYGPGASFDADKLAQQRAQAEDARRAVSNPTVSGDLRQGGIKTLNVGPMSMPVTVATRPVQKLSPITRTPTLADRVAQSAADVASYLSNAAGSAVQSVFGDVFKTKADGPLGSGAYDRIPQSGTVSLPKSAGPLGLSAYDRVPTISAVTTPEPNYRYTYDAPAGPPTQEQFRQSEINRLAEEIRMIDKYGPEPTPTGNPNMAGSPLNVPATVPSTVGNRLPEVDVPLEVRTMRPYDMQGTRVMPGEERVIRVDTVPPESQRPTYAAGTYTSPYDKKPSTDYSSLYKAASEALDPYYNAGANQFQSLKNGIGDIYSPDDEFSQSSKIPNWAQGSGSNRTRSIAAPEAPGAAPGENPMQAGNPPNPANNPVQDDSVDSPYVNPVTGTAVYPEKTLPEKILSKTTYGKALVGLGRGVGKWEFDRLTPREQADLMEKWAKENESYGRDPGRQTNQGELPRPEPIASRRKKNSDTGEPLGGSGNKPKEAGRPSIYYMWDVGVNIPSPSDNNYTLYQQYLAERNAQYG